MRLIDADELVKQGYEIVVGGLQYGACNKSIDIDDIPTAYDIDKVVEELEENSVMRANSKDFYDNPQNGEYVDEVVLLSRAIEIVKRGGKNE